MHTLQYLRISIVATGFLVLAGCTFQPTTNTNAVINTNAANDNANIEVVANTNETVSNENTNDSNVNSDIDTSDWQTYNSEELALSFSYPKRDGQVNYFTSSCNDDECFSGKIVGWKYIGNGDLPRSYTLAAAVSDDFAADRDAWPTDYSYFNERDSNYYLEGNKLIKVEEVGSVRELQYIIYKLTEFSPMAVNLTNAYVGTINFNEDRNGYKGLTIYFENPNSLQQVIQTMESINLQ